MRRCWVRSDNYIGGMGAIVLANALKSNKGLRELHIKGNDIGDAGITAICEALSGACGMQTTCD